MPPPVAAELERVLTKKLGFEQAAVADAKTMLARLSTVEAVQPSRIDAVTGDPKDDRILAYAVSTGADVLVTGDRKHLLPLAEYRGVRLITPQALLAELLHADA